MTEMTINPAEDIKTRKRNRLRGGFSFLRQNLKMGIYGASVAVAVRRIGLMPTCTVPAIALFAPVRS